MPSDYPDYMDTREAEAFSGLKNLAKRRVEGTSPPFVKTGDGRNAKVIYSRKAIEEWMQARMRTSTSNHTVAVQTAVGA